MPKPNSQHATASLDIHHVGIPAARHSAVLTAEINNVATAL